MMAHYANADAAGDFAEKEMKGKALEVGPATAACVEMEAVRVRGGLTDE
jgi:hypothetical protein